MVRRRGIWMAVAAVLIAVSCGGEASRTSAPATTDAMSPATEAPPTTRLDSWTEEEVSFAFGPDELFGVMTWPLEDGPHPVVVLLSGSGDEQGIRDGATTRLLVDHARQLATEGFAALRYDPPGVGRSSGGGIFPSLDERVEETRAAMDFVASLPSIDSHRLGLLGWSQGPWIMAMTAVRYPEDVAFLVSVAGSGQSVARQQVYGFTAQSQVAGLSDEDVLKAVVMGRLLIDWQLPEPIFRAATEVDLPALGDGPWVAFFELVYGSESIDPVERLRAGTEILRSVADEPWAEALYLDLMLMRLDSIPTDISAEQLMEVRAISAENLLTDPRDFLTEVRVPLLAVFGELDPNVDSQTSPGLFEKYLAEAGNEDFSIVVLPDVDHDIGLHTPGYWETVSDWLQQRFIK